MHGVLFIHKTTRVRIGERLYDLLCRMMNVKRRQTLINALKKTSFLMKLSSLVLATKMNPVWEFFLCDDVCDITALSSTEQEKAFGHFTTTFHRDTARWVDSAAARTRCNVDNWVYMSRSFHWRSYLLSSIFVGYISEGKLRPGVCFSKSPKTFWTYYGWHNSLYIFATPRF